MTQKIAVILFNLGGPDRPESIAPFLKNFFMDPAIIGAPWPVRFLLSRFIAYRRSRNQAGSAYGMLGGRSPLLENTRAQAAALQVVLNIDANVHFSVHVCMRYWHPMSDAVARDVAATHPDQIILLPLYPQFSTTTTGSSLAVWHRAAARIGLTVPTRAVCCYHDLPGFVAASADHIRAAYTACITQHPHLKKPRVLFSAHGLPEKIIRAGDPYQSQVERTATAVAQACGIDNLDWQVCYQSRVGPLKWTGPSTEDALRAAAADNVPVVVYPHAFVSEHVETLVEIEHEYRDLAAYIGVPAFFRAQTVMTHPGFIGGLADMVQAQVGQVGLASAAGPCQCDETRKNCPMRKEISCVR
jgi:protoporphyrin/coproporphyrin ferrochelatase